MNSVLLPEALVGVFGDMYLSRSQFLFDDEWFACNALVDIFDIICGGFEMTCSIVALRYITMIFCAVVNGHVKIRYRSESEIRLGNPGIY